MRDVLAEQVPRWDAVPAHPAGTRPVVAISRQPGARGREVAQAVAERLSLQVHDRDIIHRIAHEAHFREDAVASLEDHERPLLTEWLDSFATDAPLTRFAYLHHLRLVVEDVARKGGVILGRGAHLLLGPGRALRVFVVAPLDARVRTVMDRHDGLSARQALEAISAREAARRAFLKTLFHADFGDPTTFDLVVNTGVLGVEGAVRAIQAGAEKELALQRM
jgi:cytidylate kinase